jgi:hypothetical protein
MLDITPEKVAHVIVKAREYDSKVASWDGASSSDAQDDPDSFSRIMPTIRRAPSWWPLSAGSTWTSR